MLCRRPREILASSCQELTQTCQDLAIATTALEVPVRLTVPTGGNSVPPRACHGPVDHAIQRREVRKSGRAEVNSPRYGHDRRGGEGRGGGVINGAGGMGWAKVARAASTRASIEFGRARTYRPRWQRDDRRGRQRPCPGPDRGRSRRAAAPIAERRRRRHRGRAHPRQRSAGRQPAGEERAGRRRRAAGAAGLVRGPDPGHASASCCSTRSTRRWPLAACTVRTAAVVTRTLVDRRRLRLHRAEQADRSLPAGGRGPDDDRARPGLAGPGRARLAPGGRLARAGRGARRRRPSWRCSTPAIVVVAGGGGGIPVVREPDGTLRGVEAVIDKDLAAAVLGRAVGARGAGDRAPTCRRSGSATAPGRRASARPGERRRAAAVRGRGPVRRPVRWGRRSRRPAGSSMAAGNGP